MKVKCLVEKFLAQRQRRILKIWLRHVEDLKELEEKMVHVCELEAGRNLSDIEDELRSLEDIKDYQEGKIESLDYQVDSEMGSLRDLIDY
jgi:hypothetical protein